MYGKGLRPLSLATVASLTTALALVFFYAPNDADQGFIQKIFYVHVPMAIVTLLALPLSVPLVIAAARASAPLLTEGGAGALEGRWLAVLGLYDLVFGLLAYAIFDFLLED